MEARTRLNGLLVQEEWEELLDSAEELAASPVGRGWLDLQRFVLTAFRALGPEYDLAASAVRRALSGFLADHPDLPTRVLADGSAAANSDTLAWLRAEGIHDTAPVIRQMLARIESSTMDEWSLAQAAVAPPQPTAPAPQPEVPAGEGEEPEQEDGAGVEEEAEAPEGEVAEGEVQDG